MNTHSTPFSAPATALKPRMDHWSAAPALMQRLRDLQPDDDSAGIEPSLRFLLMLRVSQINGCAFCMNLHSSEAKSHGESDQRLFLLSAWHETNLFTPRERAALHWAEVLTRLPGGHVSDADFDALRAEFSEFEIAAVTFVIATINAWNRFGVGLRPSIETAAK